MFLIAIHEYLTYMIFPFLFDHLRIFSPEKQQPLLIINSYHLFIAHHSLSVYKQNIYTYIFLLLRVTQMFKAIHDYYANIWTFIFSLLLVNQSIML